MSLPSDGKALAASAQALLLDAASRALAHPGRRAIVRRLAHCGPLGLSQLAAVFPAVSRSTVALHLRVLCAAGVLHALPRQCRAPLDRSALPEVRALQALAQSAVDGRVQRYALCPQPLAVLHAWLGECLPPGSTDPSSAAS